MTTTVRERIVQGAVAAVLLASLVWVFFLSPSGRPSIDLPPRTADRETQAYVPPRVDPPVPVRVESYSAAAEDVWVRILDEQSQPVEDAIVWVADTRRRVDLEDLAPLGRSAQDGSCRLERAAIEALPRHSRLGFARRGFLADSRPVADISLEPETCTIVTLRRGHTFEIVARTPEGHPVPRIPFVVSLAALSIDGLDALDGTVSMPGADPRYAIHVAETDSTGLCSFTGLAAGSYDVRCRGSHMYPARGLYERQRQVPGPRLEVVMVPIHAAVLELVGDEVLGFASLVPSGPRAFGIVEDACAVVEQQLQERFPGTRVVMSVPPGDPDPKGVVHVFGRHSGWQSRPIVLRPAGEIDAPARVELGPKGADQSGILLVRLVDPDGTEIEGVRLLAIYQEESPMRMADFPLPAGVETRLPIGNYRLHSDDPYLAAILRMEPRLIEVVTGSRVERTVHLAERVRPARIRVVGPGGERFRRSQLSVMMQPMEKPARYLAVDLNRLELTVPVGGQVRVRVVANGFVPVEQVFGVPSGSSEPAEFVIRLSSGG